MIDIDNRIDEAEPGISSPDSTRAPVALLLHIVPSAAYTPLDRSGVGATPPTIYPEPVLSISAARGVATGPACQSDPLVARSRRIHARSTCTSCG